MAIFRRQLSVNECKKRPAPLPPLRPNHIRANSEDRSSIISTGSERGIFHSDSQSSLTKRSFLRKKIVELKELESGVKAGCRAICFSENPQLGSIKWVGKINLIIYIGIEFDNPIGTNFPETKGAPPFPCRIPHGRLVSQEDLILVTNPNGKTILSKQKPQNFDSIEIPISQFQNVVAVEFATKLDEFHEFCTKAEDTLDKLGGQLDQSCSRRVAVDLISISVALERHKSHLNEVEDNYSLIDWCQSKSDELFTYDEILLPSEERKISRIIQELSDMHKNIERKLKRRISDLEWALEACGTVQDLLHDKLAWITAAKERLRCMEKSLIKTESELSSRLSIIEELLSSFSVTESDEIVEILEKISELHEKTGNSPELDVNDNNEDHPNNKFDTQLGQIMSTRSQLLEEIGTKYEQYNKAKKLFQEFSKAMSSFEEWYDNYLEKISRQTDQDRNTDFLTNLEIVKEREFQRGEFLRIVKSAGKLRVSIFDPSVLDDRIQSLQSKWRNLMDVCYRDKFRKSP